MTQPKETSDFGVISPAMHVEADENNMLITLRVDSVNCIGDLETDEFKMALVTSLFKKVLHPDFRPQLISELRDRIKFYTVMEIPEGLLEDTVLAGLCDSPDGITFKYSTEETSGMAKYATQVKVKEDGDGNDD